MNNLLISEPPLQVLPSLAVKTGLNEAIILQQFHYWLQRSNNIKDGHKWIYNSIVEWQKQFPFWSKETVKRAINSLEKQGYLIVGNYNKAKFDKTKWYRINYKRLNQPLGQNDPTSGSNRTNGVGQNDPTNTNRLPETNNRESSSKESPDIFTEYQMTGATLSNNNMLVLMDYEQRLGDELVLHAIAYMDEHATKPNFNYLRQTLDGYENGNVTTIEKAEKIEKAWIEKNKARNNGYQRSAGRASTASQPKQDLGW